MTNGRNTKKTLIFSVVFLIIASIAIVLTNKGIMSMITQEISLILPMIAMYLILVRNKYCQYVWLPVNIIWFVLNIKAGLYIFAMQNVLYFVNSCVGIYIWSTGKDEMELELKDIK